MSDRSIKVTLRANVADFKREIGSAAGSLSDLAKKAGGSEKVAQTSLGKLAQSARLQREAWTTAGTALTVFGGAVVGLGAAALNTGIQYNTLQQKSRAALKTLTGSAADANAQMDKLDEFAKTSPFAKDIFIRAQQQMLGFGIEAQKVIPYLDAIQNAVAATGGSNQDISELTRIFSQVQAAAKITAVDLMQFGQRGIDAATLIGSQMGKTGAEIREEITSGTLDAGQALDALADGMAERFEGASANVKTTFAGAIDRVKAAWRDLSSELAEPLVGKEGGGLAVAGLNELADALRAFQGLPDPIKKTAAALGGVVGVSALAAGSFLLLFPRVLSIADAFGKVDGLTGSVSRNMSRLKGGVGALATAAGQAAVAFAALAIIGEGVKRGVDAMQGIDRTVQSAEELKNSLTGAADSGDYYEAVLGRLAETGAVSVREFGDLASTFETLANPSMADKIAMTFSTFDATGISDVAKQVEVLDQNLSDLAAVDIEATAAQFRGLWQEAGGTDEAARNMLESMPLLKDALYAVANEAGITADETTILRIATGDLKVGVDEAADAARGAEDAEQALADAYEASVDNLEKKTAALNDAVDAMRRQAGIAMGVAEAESAVQAAIDKASESIEKNGKTLDLNTEQGRNNQAALFDIQKATLDKVAADVAADASGRTLRASMQRGRDEFVKAAIAAGETAEAAELLADKYGLIPDNVKTVIQANATQAIAAAEAALRAIGAIPSYKLVTIGGALTSSFEAAQRAAASTQFTTLQRASGGPVYGPGTATSDSIPAWLSDGEFVVNAASTSKYRGILDLINAGRYAGGGPVRAQSYATGGAVAPMSLDGLSITGRLAMDTSGFVTLVDGRIQQHERAGSMAGRRV